MDEMEEYELNDIYNAMEYANLSDWQQTRYIVYAIAQTNSRKKLKIEDILSLPLDKGYTKNQHNQEISNEEIGQLKEMAKEVSKFIK